MSDVRSTSSLSTETGLREMLRPVWKVQFGITNPVWYEYNVDYI